MPQTNVTNVTIYDEVDLNEIQDPTSEKVHLTKGRFSTFINFANTVINLIQAVSIRNLLETLIGDNRLDASAIKNLSSATVPTVLHFTRQTRAVLTVSGMVVNPQYIAIYVERDRISPTKFTTSVNTITFNPMLQDEEVIIDYII
jgi:hypothetical protein